MIEKLRGEITIEQLISEIRREPKRLFWLLFVRSTGKERGTLKMVTKATYGAPNPGRVFQKKTKKGEPREVSMHTDRGTLPLTNHDTGEYFTPLISHIVGYNLQNVIHSNVQN